MTALQPLRMQQRWQEPDEAASLSPEYTAMPLWQHGSTNADTQARLVEVHSKLPRQVCQHCGLSFVTLKALRSRVAQKHGAQAGEGLHASLCRRSPHIVLGPP